MEYIYNPRDIHIYAYWWAWHLPTDLGNCTSLKHIQGIPEVQGRNICTRLLELTPWKESYDQPRQHIQKQRHYFANKGPSSQGYGFSSSRVWMWVLDCEESWAPKNWYFWTVVLEKTLESPMDCKEIQPVHPKGNQSWIFIGRTDAEVGNSNTLGT